MKAAFGKFEKLLKLLQTFWAGGRHITFFFRFFVFVVAAFNLFQKGLGNTIKLTILGWVQSRFVPQVTTDCRAAIYVVVVAVVFKAWN